MADGGSAATSGRAAGGAGAPSGGATVDGARARSRRAVAATAFDAAAARRRLARADPELGALLRRVGPYRIEAHEPSGAYEALVRSIVYQQLNGRAAATILGRVRALYPDARIPTPAELLATPDETLRAAGLSRNKLLALRDLAARTLDGTVPPLAELAAMDDEAIVEALTRVRGVGRWTVEMLLIFRLGRPDVLPATDYGVRKGFALTFAASGDGDEALPTPREVLERGERWRPYRSMAAWYLWRALELPAR